MFQCRQVCDCVSMWVVRIHAHMLIIHTLTQHTPHTWVVCVLCSFVRPFVRSFVRSLTSTHTSCELYGSMCVRGIPTTYVKDIHTLYTNTHSHTLDRNVCSRRHILTTKKKNHCAFGSDIFILHRRHLSVLFKTKTKLKYFFEFSFEFVGIKLVQIFQPTIYWIFFYRRREER